MKNYDTSTPEQIGTAFKQLYKRMEILNMLVKINENQAIELDLDERELKMLLLCREYAKDSFGAPNHLLMVLVNKLWDYIVKNG
jgi:hypothetical protein